MNALQSHRFLMRIALAGANLFGWIFIFQYFFVRSSDLSSALLATLIVYTLVQVVILLVTPYSAKRLRNGIKRPMTEGVVLAVIAFNVFALSFKGFFGAYILFGILLYAVLRGLYHAFYWVPYTVDSVRVGQRRPLTRTIQEGALALVPAIAGLVLTTGINGLYILFFGAAVLTFVSLVPLFNIDERHEGYSWGYTESFSKLLAPRYHGITRVAFLDGISGAALLLFWPIAVFLLVGWSYAVLGIVMSVTYLLVFLTRGYVRNALKKIDVEHSSLVHAFLAVSGWILRLLVATPFGVILVDSYFYTGSEVRGTGISRLTFEQNADHGSYIDEYTVLKEMALAAGKISVCIVGALSAALVTLPVTFIIVFLIAAVASGLSVFMSRQKHRI